MGKGLFVASSGNVAVEIIKEYIKNQNFKREAIQTTLKLGKSSTEKEK